MTITLPIEQDSFLNRLIELGRFTSRDEAVAEAVRRLAADESVTWLNPAPLSQDEADQVYAADAAWEAVEQSLAGLAGPES